MPKFNGPVIGLRFVQLRDGRKILQYSRMRDIWDTPETVPVEALPEDERDEILEVLTQYDPNAR